MKTITRLLLTAALAAATQTATAQTAAYDTSILKNGNAWEYRNYRLEDQPGFENGFDGVTRFRILDLTVSGDTARFKVAREDSGRSFIPGFFSDTTLSDGVKRDTTEYAFCDGVFSPGIPPFAVGQTFDGTEPRVVYRGDTLRLKGKDKINCAATILMNLQTVGLVKDAYVRGCGHNRTQWRFELRAFNGIPYAGDSASPVSLAPRSAPAAVSSRTLRLGPGAVQVRHAGLDYDLRGARSLRPATPLK